MEFDVLHCQNLQQGRTQISCFLGAFEFFSPDKVGILQGFCSISYLFGCKKTRFFHSADQKYLRLSEEIYQTTIPLLVVETWWVFQINVNVALLFFHFIFDANCP